MRKRQAFTLVEMMVSMALVIFIMVLLSQAFVASMQSFRLLKGVGDLKNTRLVEESGIEDYLADRYAIVGNPEECLETLQRLGHLGVTKIWLNIYTEDKIAFMKRWSKEIMAKVH